MTSATIDSFSSGRDSAPVGLFADGRIADCLHNLGTIAMDSTVGGVFGRRHAFRPHLLAFR